MQCDKNIFIRSFQNFVIFPINWNFRKILSVGGGIKYLCTIIDDEYIGL